MNETFPTFWITTYALCDGVGIVALRGRWMGEESIEAYDHPYHGEIFPSSQCHRSRDAAVAQAEQMRDSKVARLESEISRLKAMTFDTVREG